MKYPGILFLSAAMVLAGLYFSKRIKTRKETLSACVSMVSAIETQLGYCCLPTYEVLEKISHQTSLSALTFLNFEEKSDKSFEEQWSESINEQAYRLALNAEDIHLLISFGELIGTTDVDGQLGICSLYSERFGEQLKAAEENTQKYSRLCSTLGFSAGLVTAILLI